MFCILALHFHTYTVVGSISNDVSSFKRKVNGIWVTVVKIRHDSPYKPGIVLANNQIGTTQSLSDMARRYNAVAAINGTFFNAYGGHPDLWGTLIKGGKVVHINSSGTVFGFTKDGKVKMERLRIHIKGATNGSYKWPNSWYAYGLNHLPKKGASSIYIFTPEWGKRLGFSYMELTLL